MSMLPPGRIEFVRPALQPQGTGVADHLQVAAPDPLPLAVEQFTQAFPVKP